MPRSERQVPSVYFGRPGALMTLPWPLGDLDKPYERVTYDFISGGGQHTVSQLLLGSRQITASWNALHLDNFTRLSQYWEGANGSGPWAFVDPSVPNMLLPNQSSATNQRYDTTGFETSGAADQGTLLSSTASGAFIHRVGGIQALRWQFPTAAGTSPTLQLTTPYRNWPGWPAVPTLPYTFTAWARPDGTVDASITMSARLRFLDAAGALIGAEVSGGDIVMSAGYVKHTVTATAPAGTAYVRPLFVATGSTITTGGSIYIDELNLEQDSVANDWAPGTGVRPVEILALTDKVPFATRMRTAVTMTMRELAA